MSNIVTTQLRLVLRTGALSALDVDALVARLLEGGSYWVPPCVDASSGAWIDVQLGSGKGAGLVHLEPDALAPFEEIWMRSSDEGSDVDTIASFSPLLGETLLDARWRPCRYAFDHAELDGRSLAVRGSYAALNARTDMDVGARARIGPFPAVREGALSTPTTPCFHASRPTALEPAELARSLSLCRRSVLSYRGRIVQRTEPDARGRPRVQSADHWDNCADESYRLVFAGL